MRIVIPFIVLLTIAANANAADASPKGNARPKPDAPSKADAQPKLEAPPKLEIKNKSSFKLDNSSRDPFWPIGFKPVAKISHSAEGDQAGPEIAPTAFSVTSITLGAGGHFAIINGKIMQEGQQFGLQIGSQTYQITVKAIEDGRVVLSRRDSEIIIPLRRK